MCPITKTANKLHPTVYVYTSFLLYVTFRCQIVLLIPQQRSPVPPGKSNLLVDKTDGPKPSIKPKLAGSLEKNNEEKTRFYYFCGFLGHKVTNVLLHLIFKNFNHKLVRVRTNAIVKNPNPANVVLMMLSLYNSCTMYIRQTNSRKNQLSSFHVLRGFILIQALLGIFKTHKLKFKYKKGQY